MQVFKINQDGFKEIRKGSLLRTIPLLLIVSIVGIAIPYVNSGGEGFDLNVLLIIIPIVIISAGFGLYRGINRQKKLYDSYTLTISNNLITREQINTPTVSIYFNEIKEIIKNKNGSFTIKGRDAGDLILIPKQVDNYPQLETTLVSIQPLTGKSNQSLLAKYPALLALLTVGLMFCVYTIKNKIVVAVTGTILIALMIWSLVKTQRNKNIDSKTKRSVWLILIVLASIITVMIMKLTMTTGT